MVATGLEQESHSSHPCSQSGPSVPTTLPPRPLNPGAFSSRRLSPPAVLGRAMLARERGPCRARLLRQEAGLRVHGSQPHALVCCCCCSGLLQDQDKGLRVPGSCQVHWPSCDSHRRLPRPWELQLSPLQSTISPHEATTTPQHICSNAISQRPQNCDKHFTLTAVFSRRCQACLVLCPAVMRGVCGRILGQRCPAELNAGALWARAM